MSTTNPEALTRLTQLTRDYGRVPDQSAGLSSLWTAACLALLGTLTFQWLLGTFHAAGSPAGGLLRFVTRHPQPLPSWLLLVAFGLPLLWAPVMRGLSRLLYTEPYGRVQGIAPPWDLGLGPLVRPIDRWAPLVILSGLALSAGILSPLLDRLLGLASGHWSNIPALRWRYLLAPLLGLVWVWLAPRLRKAEASEGAILVYMAGFLFTVKYAETLFFIIPLYFLMVLGLVGYGIWAHLRHQRAVAQLASTAEASTDA